jgi:hypothetical protein
MFTIFFRFQGPVIKIAAVLQDKSVKAKFYKTKVFLENDNPFQQILPMSDCVRHRTRRLKCSNSEADKNLLGSPNVRIHMTFLLPALSMNRLYQNEPAAFSIKGHSIVLTQLLFVSKS